jgi:GLPGLI family protein
MKNFMLVKALIICAVCTKAQPPDTAQVLIHYKFAHVRDTGNRANPYTENMLLVIGKRCGVYRSYDRELEYAFIKKQTLDAIARSGGGGITVDQRYTASGAKYYQFPQEKKLVWKESLLFSNFLITEDMPVIKWQISNDTATFGGLHCQKATCHFKGRNYTAWFCPDLPLPLGPWELNGLPGVIVNAYDTKKEVCFIFNGIEKAPAPDANARPLPIPPGPGADEADIDPNIIKVPRDATKTTAKEFAKLRDAGKKDPAAFAQVASAGAAQNGPAGDVKGPKMSLSSGPAQKGPAFNNPIELPEKQ